MTNPALATDTFNGRVYKDTLPDCPILTEHGWSGPFEAPSVTTINKAADRSGGLDLWKRRTVAEWAIDNTHVWPQLEDHKINPDLWVETVDRWANQAGWSGRGPKSVYRRAIDEYRAAAAAGDREACEAWHRKLAVDVCAAAPDRHAREKAQQGTDLHKVMEDVAHGRTPVALLPEDQVHIDQVKEWCDRWQPEFVHAERSVFSRTHGYAGTPDAFVKLPGIGTVVADWKRQTQVYDQVAYQLAPYAHADYLIDGNLVHTRRPIPDLVGGVVVHFPPDGSAAKVHPVELDGAMDVFLHTLELHKVKNEKRVKDPVDAPSPIPGDPDMRAQLQARIALYRAFYADTGILLWVSTHWPDGVPTLKQSDAHTAAELARIHRLLDQAEAEHQIPFDPPVVDGPSKSNSNDNSKVTAA